MRSSNSGRVDILQYRIGRGDSHRLIEGINGNRIIIQATKYPQEQQRK